MQIALAQATGQPATTEKPHQAVLIPIAPVSLIVPESKLSILISPYHYLPATTTQAPVTIGTICRNECLVSGPLLRGASCSLTISYLPPLDNPNPEISFPPQPHVLLAISELFQVVVHLKNFEQLCANSVCPGDENNSHNSHCFYVFVSHCVKWFGGEKGADFGMETIEFWNRNIGKNCRKWIGQKSIFSAIWGKSVVP